MGCQVRNVGRRQMKRTMFRLVVALVRQGPDTRYTMPERAKLPCHRDHRQKVWGYRGVSVPVDWRSQVLTLQQCSDLGCLAGLALRRVPLHCNTHHNNACRVYVRFHMQHWPWLIDSCMLRRTVRDYHRIRSTNI